MRNVIMKYYVTLYLTRKDTVYRAQLMKKEMMCYLTDNGSSSMSSQMLKVSHVLTYDALGKAPVIDHTSPPHCISCTEICLLTSVR